MGMTILVVVQPAEKHLEFMSLLSQSSGMQCEVCKLNLTGVTLVSNQQSVCVWSVTSVLDS